jgi:streptogramin lyase
MSNGIATDASGNLWVADYEGGPDQNGAFAEVVTSSSVTSAPISGYTVGGINHPQGIAIDAGQNVWFTNFIDRSITEIAGSASAVPGTAISPSTGVYGPGGYGLDTYLSRPYSIVPDRSGNLWVSNDGVSVVTMFFGLATPTVTPVQSVPTPP